MPAVHQSQPQLATFQLIWPVKSEQDGQRDWEQSPEPLRAQPETLRASLKATVANLEQNPAHVDGPEGGRPLLEARIEDVAVFAVFG